MSGITHSLSLTPYSFMTKYTINFWSNFALSFTKKINIYYIKNLALVKAGNGSFTKTHDIPSVTTSCQWKCTLHICSKDSLTWRWSRNVSYNEAVYSDTTSMQSSSTIRFQTLQNSTERRQLFGCTPAQELPVCSNSVLSRPNSTDWSHANPLFGMWSTSKNTYTNIKQTQSYIKCW